MEKMTQEDFHKRIKKYSWMCKVFPHKNINADNEVIQGVNLCTRCGLIQLRTLTGK